MKISVDQYVTRLSEILEANKDLEYALRMKKYMKNLFPFYGINSPFRKEIFKQFNRDEGIPRIQEVNDIVKALYKRQEREFHYFAMELANRYSKKFDDKGIKLFEYLIVNHSWWDTVDYIAANSVGNYFRVHPELKHSVTTLWMESGNIWLQRSCILFQLKYKRDTDLELLYSFIDKLRFSNEFFIQKSIGWILREYSKLDPDEVYRFVSSTILKPLSTREARRIMNKSGFIESGK
jgi:3-methyladenine DNA glycosylase AlkD